MARVNQRYPQELKDRAVWLVFESRESVRVGVGGDRIDRDEVGDRVDRGPSHVGPAVRRLMPGSVRV